MIFLNVNNLPNKSQKSFFVEQIDVYCRLIEVFCEKNAKLVKFIATNGV